AVGPEACPFTTLYWDFLARHKTELLTNQRMTFQMKNLNRLEPERLKAIRSRAETLRGTKIRS
ncbi:MAG: cryptochrome/photolyase family protein, partial [Verrucomicrobiota bacterium]